MRYLLDTNICIRYLNGRSNPIRQQCPIGALRLTRQQSHGKSVELAE